jgi:hypothetical protein
MWKDILIFFLRVLKAKWLETTASRFFSDLTLHGVTWPILLHAEYFGPTYFTDETGSYTTMGFTLGNHIDLILNAEADLEK